MKRSIILFAALAIPFGLSAQNLNPEVQVTNEYVSQINDVVKQGPAMTVPDSMLRFDYHFDYSVFETPYKGAYEFSPYSVSITPAAGGYDGRKLYLRAGAGYVLKPELDVLWAAVDGKKMAVNLFAGGDGFLGNYLGIGKDTFVSDKSVKHFGWDFGTKAGVDTRINIGQAVLRAEIGYEGIFTGHELYQRGFGHAPYASVKLKKDNADGFAYAASVSYRYVNDHVEGWGPLQDHDIRLNATVSPYVNRKCRVGMDISFAYNTFYYTAEVHPHIVFRAGKWDFDAGLRLDWFDGRSIVQDLNPRPDVRATLHLFKNRFDIYAGAVGRDYVMSFWDYKVRAHRYFTNYVDPRPVQEIADCFLGFRGFTGFGLRYDVKAGYRFLEDVPFWAVSASGDEDIRFVSCNLLHADAELNWTSKRFDVEAAAHYIWLPEELEDRVFAPSTVTADLKVTYNWFRRIYAGLSGGMASSRRAMVGANAVEIPWYIDLGAYAEYKLNSKLGFWLKGSNLLNQEIRQSPMFCQYGPSVIAGVTLSL